MKILLICTAAVLNFTNPCFATGPDGYTEKLELISELRSNQSISITSETLRCYPPTVNQPWTQGLLFIHGLGTSTDSVFLQSDMIRDCALIDSISKKAQATQNELPAEIIQKLYKVTRTYDSSEADVFEKCEIEISVHVERDFSPYFSTHDNMTVSDPQACYPKQ